MMMSKLEMQPNMFIRSDLNNLSSSMGNKRLWDGLPMRCLCFSDSSYLSLM